MNLLNYLKPTIEGKDGKASMKRLTIFLFVVLFTVAFFGDFFSDLYVSDTILDLLATVIIAGILGNHAEAMFGKQTKELNEQENGN